MTIRELVQEFKDTNIESDPWAFSHKTSATHPFGINLGTGNDEDEFLFNRREMVALWFHLSRLLGLTG